MFFVFAQLSGTAAALALIQALALRRGTMSPSELAVLVRRNLVASIAAGVTMFAAGAAVPGQAPALALLAGPVIACVALVGVLRTRRLTLRTQHLRPGASVIIRRYGAWSAAGHPRTRAWPDPRATTQLETRRAPTGGTALHGSPRAIRMVVLGLQGVSARFARQPADVASALTSLARPRQAHRCPPSGATFAPR